MLKVSLLAVTAAFATAAWAQSFAQAQVRYLHPEKFTDASRYPGGGGRDAYLVELAKHIERRAAPLLGGNRRLAVDISEVDLAGGFEPWRAQLADTRIVRDVYPPRIDLTFRLTAADGSLLKEGERKLREPVFAITGNAYRDDPLRYEKALLDAWLERELKLKLYNGCARRRRAA